MTLQDTPPDTVDDAAPAAAAPDTTRRLKFVIVALAALCLALTVLAVSVSTRNNTTEGRTAAVRRVSGRFGTAILTYDYHHLEKWKAGVVSLATAGFKKQFNDSYPAFSQLYKATKGHSEPRDVTVYVGDVTGNDASTLVQVDYRVSGVGGKNRPQVAYFEVTLVHTSDGWRVADLGNVDTSQSGSTATTTPAG